MKRKSNEETKSAESEMIVWSVVTTKHEDGGRTRIRDFTSERRARSEFWSEFRRIDGKIYENHIDECVECRVRGEDLLICECDSRNCNEYHSKDITPCEGNEQLKVVSNTSHPYDKKRAQY